MRMNVLLQKINWEEELADNSVQQMTDKVLGAIEKNVSLIFKKKDEFVDVLKYHVSQSQFFQRTWVCFRLSGLWRARCCMWRSVVER